MPTDSSPDSLPPQTESDVRDAAEGTASDGTLGGSRAESPRRRAHRDRIKSLLAPTRARSQTA